ncbi:MAG TPA: hypothetical protein VND93_20470 [Myxococcales bacterium]|nr:hypothetical protein [Myxococcales bacterium]
MNAIRLNAARLLPLAVLAAAACAPVVQVQTDPVNQSIPVTSVGVQAYVEVAIDLPPESQGDVLVNQALLDVQVQNASRSAKMLVELRASLQGTATPETPYAFTEANRPAYFANSIAVLAPKSYDAGATVQEHVDATPLRDAIGKPRLWLIVANTVTSVGFGEVFPLQINLNQIILHATVTKSLAGAGGALETTGM